MLMPKKMFRQELEKTLHGHLTLSHPIFGELVADGKPDIALLRNITLQGYQLTKHFLSYIEHLFFFCPLPQFKRALLVNCYEEETGKLSGTDNHVTLMQNFIKALGVTNAERDAMVALPATQELIDYRHELVRDPARYHMGAAAVMIASEGQNLETAGGQARHEVLGTLFGLRPSDTLFFSVHQQEDVGHVNQGLSLVSTLCRTEREQREALEAVDRTCRLFYGMYENMHQAYCRPAAAYPPQAAAGVDAPLPPAAASRSNPAARPA